jgi:glycosyltransferase involved in cell wall biosynthesis
VSLGVEDRIHFEGWVEHARVLGLMRDARAALYTGMREEGGLALGEALLLGCPVIVLRNGGSGMLASSVEDRDRVTLVEPRGRAATISSMATAIDDHWRSPRRRRDPLIDRDAAVARLEAIVRRAAAG